MIETKPAFEAHVTIGATVIVGKTPRGLRMMVPITGGTFEGARLRGNVLPSGADIQLLRPDGALEVEARYALEAHDGAGIMVVNRGIYRAPPEVSSRLMSGDTVSPSEFYFRTCAQFEAPVGSDYEWLNASLFVSRVEPTRGSVHVRFFEVV
jgi:hypothetical protein